MNARKLAPCTDASIYHGGAWPTAAQQLLLKAALLQGAEAIQAWEEWQATAQFDALDSGSWRMLPLLYANLKRQRARDPLLLQARDCYVQQWICTQRLFQQSAAFLDELERLNIPALVLKGVALAHLYYPETGMRPMADLDLLVPEDKFHSLGEKLLGEGWKETDGYSFAGFRMDELPSFGFMRQDGFWVDIHCHLLHSDCARGADSGFWARARPWTFRQRPARTLAPEDHLLHVVSHGARWCDVPPFRWVADAWWILARSRNEFDWEHLCRQARLHAVNLTLFHGLNFMNQLTPLDLPHDVLARLERMPVSPRARVRFIAETVSIPVSFFARGRAIWRALKDNSPGYSIVGRQDHGIRTARIALPALLLYGVRVAIREAWKFLTRPLRGGRLERIGEARVQVKVKE